MMYVFLVMFRHKKQEIIDCCSRMKHVNLEEQVDLIRTTQVRKAAASFEMSTACIGVTFVHLFFHGLGQRTAITHLQIQTCTHKHTANSNSLYDIIAEKSYFCDKIVGGWALPQPT